MENSIGSNGSIWEAWEKDEEKQEGCFPGFKLFFIH